jgi:hypothetical protein
LDNTLARLKPGAWRTPTAIWVAATIGTAAGVFLYMTAVPFGPVLFGWFIVLVGATIVSTGLCFMATHGFMYVRIAYAVGVAIGALLMGLFAPRGEPVIWWLPLQFTIIFGLVFSVSLLVPGFWVVLNWAEERFRKWEGRIE